MQKIRQDISMGQNIKAMRIAAHMTQEQVVARMQLAGCDISGSIYLQIQGGTYNIRVSLSFLLISLVWIIIRFFKTFDSVGRAIKIERDCRMTAFFPFWPVYSNK